MKRFIGIDLHKNMFVACILWGKGNKIFKEYLLKDLDLFKKELKKGDCLGIEATTNTRFFVQEIREYVKEVKVINPHQFKIICKSTKKTDKIDAQVIAFYLSKGMIPEVRIKEKNSSELLSLATTRDRLVKLRTALKNKIHNILSSYGIVTKKEFLSSEKGLQRVMEMEISDCAKIEVKIVIEQIQSLTKGIDELEDAIVKKWKSVKGFENITSIKGIGNLSGVILLSVIGDIKDFESEKKLDSYLGIVPRVEQSNDKLIYGKITKNGNKLARKTLVQCAWIAIKYSDYLKRFYAKLAIKKGKAKAIIATARKLLGIIYKTLINNWVFEDFTKFSKKPAY